MRNIFITILLITSAAFAATRYIEGDAIRSADRAKTWTPPAVTDTLVGIAAAQTLTNKTLTAPSMTTIVTSGGTLTLPTVTDTLVGKATTDILTNKTISTATVSGTITTQLTASRAMVTGASNELAISAVTATELGYVSGATSGLQGQINTLGAPTGSEILNNHGLAASVAANALTIALKDSAGSDPTAGSPVKIGFRSATLTTGTITVVSVTAALSTVISSGSTAGHTNAQDGNIYVGLLNNAGTAELCWSTRPFDENALISTTAEGGAGAADSATVIYSTTARSSVAVRIIGKLVSNQTTAGTWAAVPTNTSVGSAPKVLAYLPPTVQTFLSSSGTYTLPTSPRKPLWIQVEMVGPGGGGAGSASSAANGGAGAAGAASTTFGTSLLTCAAGGGGGAAGGSGAGGTGGAATCSAPAICLIALSGSSGTGVAGLATFLSGPPGAPTPFSGGGGGGVAGGAGSAAPINSGAGGGGAGVTVSGYSGGSGGAGAYIKAIIVNPSATYSYVVGGIGGGGTAGTSGFVGGNSGVGQIVVTEHYQ
jgi:hypothetical protein